MNGTELLRVVDENSDTTEQMVAEAKLYILDNFQSNSTYLLRALLESRDCKIPEMLDLMNNSIEVAGVHLGKSVSWWNAGVQALCSLQGQGLLVPYNNEVVQSIRSVRYVSGSSNMRSESSVNFEHRFFHVIQSVRQAPVSNVDVALLNSDIYLNNLSIPNLSSHIADDLRQAIQCFRGELYLPCITMLGRAMEGAWIQMGESLYPLIKNTSAQNKLKSNIEDVFVGIAKKIDLISEAYKVKDDFGAIYTSSTVSKNRLNAVRQWSDQIREYRNAIHPAATPSITFNYQNVSVILMSVKDNFEAIDKVVQSANQTTP